MKRALLAIVLGALLVAAPAFGQATNGWAEMANGWGEIQTPPGYGTIPPPAGCVATSVLFFGTPVTAGPVCDAGFTYDAATDTLTSGRVLVGNGTAAAPSVAFAGGPTTGLYSPNSYTLALAANGVGIASMTGAGFATAAGFPFVVEGRTSLGSPAAATLQLGPANSATGAAVAQTLQTQSNITQSDVAAPASFTIIGPRGTGTGAAGNLVFQTGVPQATGATAHVPATALTLTNAGTGGTSAPQALFADGTAAKPSVSFMGSPTTGIYAAANVLSLVSGGVGWGTGSSAGVVFSPYNFTFGTTILRAITAGVQLGAPDSATPVAQTLRAQGGVGTDIPGANLTIQSGAGSGAGAGSTLTFKVPNVTTTGTTAQTQVTRLTIQQGAVTVATGLVPNPTDGVVLGASSALWSTGYFARATLGSKSKAITDNVATAFATFTIADAYDYGGTLIYKVRSVEGTAIQSLIGKVNFTATREGATYAATVNTTHEALEQTLTGAGTLTGGVTLACTAGVCTFSANFNTSQTTPTMTISARVDSPDSGLALSFP